MSEKRLKAWIKISRVFYSDRKRIHKPKFSKVSGRSQDMRNFWKQKRMSAPWTITADISLLETKITPEERKKRERNRVNSGEQAIIARIQSRSEARKLQKREELEREARILNDILMSQKEQRMSPKARKMGIRPSRVGCIKI